MTRKKNPHVGSKLDDFQKSAGVYEELQAEAMKEVAAWQLGEAIRQRGVSKAGMTKLLHTSRTQVNRLPDPRSGITIS